MKVAALKEHFRNLNPNKKKLKRADFLGFTVIPTFASVAGYWIIGMMKYNSPYWSAYTFLVPDFQVNHQRWREKATDISCSYQHMMEVALDHFKSFFASNSTLMRSLEEAGSNLTYLVSEALQNSSILQTWNQTLQETMQTI